MGDLERNQVWLLSLEISSLVGALDMCANNNNSNNTTNNNAKFQVVNAVKGVTRNATYRKLISFFLSTII